MAGAVAALLALHRRSWCWPGCSSPPPLIDLIAPGFEARSANSTIRLVRILFPGAGLLVLSAWCLGILNSHRRFFLPTPRRWSGTWRSSSRLVRRGGPGNRGADSAIGAARARCRRRSSSCWSSCPGATGCSGASAPSLDRGSTRGPDRDPRISSRSFVGRGVVQVSATSTRSSPACCRTGAVAGLANAQVLYTLPVSLFGMSVVGGRAARDGQRHRAPRLERAAPSGPPRAGLRQIAFFVVPSAVAFLALGDVVAGAALQTGAFTRPTASGSGASWPARRSGCWPPPGAALRLGLLRTARHPDAAPVRRVRVASHHRPGLSSRPAPARACSGIDPKWGAAGLTASAGVAGWVEFLLLRRGLNRRIGRTGHPAGAVCSGSGPRRSPAAARRWGSRAAGRCIRHLASGLTTLLATACLPAP